MLAGLRQLDGRLERGLVPGLLGLGTIRVPPLPAPFALGELLLEPARVQQHQAGELDRPGRRTDGTVEPLSDDVRDQAAVVKVGVREQDRVERGGVERQRDPVADRLAGPSLEHPAVHEDACLAGLEKELAAGHRGGGAEEVEVHAADGATGRGPASGCTRSPLRRDPEHQPETVSETRARQRPAYATRTATSASTATATKSSVRYVIENL